MRARFTNGIGLAILNFERNQSIVVTMLTDVSLQLIFAQKFIFAIDPKIIYAYSPIRNCRRTMLTENALEFVE